MNSSSTYVLVAGGGNNSNKSNVPDDKEQKFWLYAFRDHMAHLRTFNNSICTADLNHDGDYKLLIADGSKRLKVYGGTKLEEQYKLAGVPSCITTFVMQDNNPESIYPIVAIGVGEHVFMYRNGNPLYRFALPKVHVNDEEVKLWDALVHKVITMDKLLATLREKIDKHAQLSSVMCELLLFDNPAEREAFVQRRLTLPLEELDVVTCMNTVGIDHDARNDAATSSCLLIGTERRWVYMVHGASFEVTLKVELPSTPVRLFVMGCVHAEYRVLASCRDGLIYTITNNVLRNYVIRTDAHPTAIAQYDNLLAIATTRNAPDVDSIYYLNASTISVNSYSTTNTNNNNNNNDVKARKDNEITEDDCVSSVVMIGNPAPACSTMISYYTLKGNKKEEFSISLPCSVTHLETITDPVTRVARATIVALHNGELRVYVQRELRHVRQLYGAVQSMCYSRYGREDSALITVMQSGTLLIQLLHRKANLSLPTQPVLPTVTTTTTRDELLEEKKVTALPLSESLSCKTAISSNANMNQTVMDSSTNVLTNRSNNSFDIDVNIKLPKVSNLFNKQMEREMYGAIDMYRLFQYDLCRLRLMTAKTFLSTLSGRNQINQLNSSCNVYTKKNLIHDDQSSTESALVNKAVIENEEVKQLYNIDEANNKSNKIEHSDVDKLVYLVKSKNDIILDDNTIKSDDNDRNNSNKTYDNDTWKEYEEENNYLSCEVKEFDASKQKQNFTECSRSKIAFLPIKQQISTVNMLVMSAGVGPLFKLTCNICNETNHIIYDLMLTFNYDNEKYYMPRKMISIPYLYPWRPYRCIINIRLKNEKVKCGTVTTTLIAKKQCITQLTSITKLITLIN